MSKVELWKRISAALTEWQHDRMTQYLHEQVTALITQYTNEATAWEERKAQAKAKKKASQPISEARQRQLQIQGWSRDRMQVIWNLREGGMTFVEIGKAMGISSGRAAQIYAKQCRINKHGRVD